MKKQIALGLTLIFLTGTTAVANAATATVCTTPIYGGGQGACADKMTTTKSPTATPAVSAGGPQKFAYAPITTKGGFPVSQTQTTTKTPPTGPDTLPMVALGIAGFLGLILRNKTKLSYKL